MSLQSKKTTDANVIDASEKRSYHGIGLWCCLSLTAATAFLVWPFQDAQFNFVLKTMMNVSGIDSNPQAGSLIVDSVTNDIKSWTGLGQRYVVFSAFSAFALIGSLVAMIQFVRYANPFRTVAIVCIVGCWIGLWWLYPTILDRAVLHHVHSALPRMQKIAPELLRAWPTSRGSLTTGEIYVPSDDRVTLHFGSEHHASLHMGQEIERLPTQCLRIGLSFYDGHQLEYRTDGSKPASFVDKYGWEMILVKDVPLPEVNWYLVRYERQW